MKWASEQDVEAAVEEWSDRYVQCRAWGHPWQSQTVTRTANGLFLISHRCQRCKTIRRQEMDKRGFATPWTYLYAKNYLAENLGRIGADGRRHLRLGAIRHLTVHRIEEEE